MGIPNDGVFFLRAMAIEAFHSGLNVVEVFRHTTVEAGRPRGVVDTGAGRHGSQAQGGAQADAMQGHLVGTPYHRAKVSFRCVPGSVHLVC
jgi:hypothetical protein